MSSMQNGSGAGQVWNAEKYAENGRFVADLAGDVLAMLAPAPGEHILDLGCGDGALTERIAEAGAIVTGCDRSPQMLKAAAARGIQTVQADMTRLPFDTSFDAVFSNAALHWTVNQRDTLAGVYRALRPGGRFVAEMGGLGNIAAIRVALQTILHPHGIDAEEHAASFYPSAEEYARLLEAAGLQVEEIHLVPRPTRLPNGMEAWLRTFRNGVLGLLAETTREIAIQDTVELLRPVLCDSKGVWWADYVRLRFRANRN